MPAPVLARHEVDFDITAAIVALAAPSSGERLGQGLEPLGGGPEALARHLRANYARFGAFLTKLDVRFY